MRTLAIAALSFSAAVFAANLLLPFGTLPFVAAGAALAAAALFLTRRLWLRGFALACAAAACGFLFFALYAGRTAVPAREISGERLQLRARVVGVPQEYEQYARAEVELRTEGLPHLRLLLTDNSKTVAEAVPGQWIEFEAVPRPADQRYGKRYTAWNARGIFLTASARGEVRLGETESPLALLPLKLNRLLLRQIAAVFPEDTSAFFQSLLLGDKTELYRETELELAMSRAGLMHVVAVSGMHVAFLLGLLQSVLGRNRLSSLLGMALVWCFVLITGAGPSAVRAAVMQSFVLLAPLLRRENDPLTSLSAALALILLTNPYASGSVGLQLSFAAVAGLFCFAGRLSEAVYARLPALRGNAAGRFAVGTVVNSLSVVPFTFPLLALHFGYVSLVSPVTNLLALWAVSLCFCCAFPICLLGFVSLPLAAFLGAGLAWFARFILLAAKFCSSLPFAVVYLDSVTMKVWMVLVYLFFIGFHFARLPAAGRFLLPAALSALTLLLLFGAMRQYYRGGAGAISVLDVGQGQCICVFSGENTVMVDCGGFSTLDNAGETAGQYLISRGRGRVDALILTHLDADHCNGVPMLLALRPVDRILIAAGAEQTNGWPEKIAEAAELHGTQLEYLAADSERSFGGIRARIFLARGDSADEPCLAALLSLASYDMLVTGDIPRKAEAELMRTHDIRDVELCIVGHHGSRNASSWELLHGCGAQTAVISSGYNTYGHPTPETLERLAIAGYTVYRTDENGTIRIRVGKDYG